ncbi:unnamed protein product [Soboliphyme baturini]|uniref:ATP synthase subunit gamma n=1 Tax=Soboliphyme baturini TaxID=241478 RepID=A0A183J128_9BILA|nr:unnamed protein product [Soboliphyme baturini]
MIGSQGIRVFCPTVSLLRSFHTSLNRLATLKDSMCFPFVLLLLQYDVVSIRLKSVKNIQKITQSMKMVAAAKYNRAERELRPARQYGQGSLGLLDHIKVTEELPQKSNHIIIVMTSDRGLCGAVHSNIIKMVKADLLLHKDKFIPKIVCIGEKSKIVLTRVPPTFSDARRITDHILNSGFAFTQGNIYYNRFRSVVSYKSTRQPVFSTPVIVNTPSFSVYDSVDDSTFESFFEYNLASMLYYAMKENACSEQSSRMTAMDSASKNAGEMIARLSLHYNRTRQAVITRELIDIVIGASAL